MASANESKRPQAAEEAEAPAKPVAKKQKDNGRVPTGISGLDEMIGGGFEKNSSTVVMGDAGCGKTTFLAQFLYKGASEYNDPSVMLSFEEQSDSILRHMGMYGFDFASLEKQGLFSSISYRPHEVKKLIDEGGGLILDTLTSVGAKRLAIDSLTSYAILFETAYQAREAEITLFELLQKWKCTTLLSAEGRELSRKRVTAGTEYLADAVILLHHPRHQSMRYRAIEILKMRGAKQSEKICPFDIVAGTGIKVYPNQEIFYNLGNQDD
jgi:KaiC/GvpD/RAD55 family RecA-like ATPase